MKNAPHSSAPCLEALEPRLAPAGIVTITLAGGVLTLTGDGLDNNVKISSPTANIWQISDLNADAEGNVPTTFRMAGRPDATSMDFSTYAGLKVSLNGGNDKLDVISLFTNGPVTLAGGDGDDELYLSGTINGAINIDGGNGNDDMGIIGGFINNTVTIKGGIGDDTAFFGSGIYSRGLTADLGTGSNQFTLLTDSSLNVFGNINFTAAGGATNTQNYFLALKDGSIIGNVLLKTGAGAANHYLGRNAADTLTIYGSLTVTGAAGNDTLLLAGKVSIGGGMNFNFGAGSNFLANALDTGDVNLLSSLRLGSLSYTGGIGRDTLFLDVPEFIVGGSVTTTMGAGINAFSLRSTIGAVIGGALSYVGGASDDMLEIYGTEITVGGKLSYKGGGSMVGNGALGEDEAFIVTNYAALGSVELIGGTKGDDVFYLGNPNQSGSTLISVLGNVVINTAAGNSVVYLTDTYIQGSVSHTSAVAFSSGVNLDIFSVEDSYIQGSLLVNAGGSASAGISLNDSIFVANVTLNTGAGDDFVYFDSVATNETTQSFRRSFFYGIVNVSLGAGNDTWIAGMDPLTENVGSTFYNKVKIDGGAGTNNKAIFSYSNNGSNTFAIAPVFTSLILG